MPELPEVHIMKNRLNRYIKGSTIQRAQLSVSKSLKTHNEDIFNMNLKGQTIINVTSYAKYLIFELTNYWMLTHQRMEGKFSLNDEIKYDIFSLDLDINKTLHFKDHRKFATVELYEKKKIQYKELPFFNKIGRLPWEANAKNLLESTSKKSIAIKSTLLDQKYIAGLGNIYVDEVLYAAKISPLRETKKITLKEWELILFESTRILKLSIKLGGSSIRTYSALDKPGKYQNELKVHTREGEEIKGHKIIKIKVGGRGTYFIPELQK